MSPALQLQRMGWGVGGWPWPGCVQGVWGAQEVRHTTTAWSAESLLSPLHLVFVPSQATAEPSGTRWGEKLFFNLENTNSPVKFCFLHVCVCSLFPALRARIVFLCGCVLYCCHVRLRPSGPQPAGASVHRVLQARTLEWVAVPSSRGSPQPRDPGHVSYISCIGRWVLNH